MTTSMHELPDLDGGCLCGQVRFRITGPRRDIINCHCWNCRRTHGHVAAYTSVDKNNLSLIKRQSLKWYHDRSPGTYRGFCSECGSSLFWDAGDEKNKMAVSAGTLDACHGLKTIGHVYVREAGDYYEISDNLPRFEGSSTGQLEAN